ncbi:MAG TPA: hypothetical protein VK145_01510 [Candidatus Nanoarchaeia archaeon]|nr:hypothetical protein [Candidatus Nanoarchaeia archaeon]
MKKSILRIMSWSAVALIVPLLGNTFVDGWNWSWHDFLFAWVFFVVMSTSILFATKKVSNPNYRIAAGAVVFLVFAAIWVMLATG